MDLNLSRLNHDLLMLRELYSFQLSDNHNKSASYQVLPNLTNLKVCFVLMDFCANYGVSFVNWDRLVDFIYLKKS